MPEEPEPNESTPDTPTDHDKPATAEPAATTGVLSEIKEEKSDASRASNSNPATKANREEATPPKPTNPIRWWPLIVIVIGATVAVIAIIAGSGDNRQKGVMMCMAVGMLAFAMSLIWLVLFSRLPTKPRLAGLAGLIGVLMAGYGLFEIKGTSGDLVPILGWRFANDELAVPEATAKANSEVAAAAEMEGAANFVQFFGPNRDGKLSGPKLAKDWNAQPPTELWRREVGAGWSGFSVKGGLAITQEQRGDQESVVCYDLLSGEVIWSHSDEARYFTVLGGLGPRATATIDGERVFSQGATGILNCLDLQSGEKVWSVDILKDNAASLPEWGVAGSPLILDDLVIVNPGGQSQRSIVAYNKKSGERAWSGGSDAANWSSPVVATLAGVRQILVFGAKGVAGHDAANGKVLWDHPWKGGHPHVSMPIAVSDKEVFVSSGYGTGAQLLEVLKSEDGSFTVERVWRSMAMKAKFANLILLDGHVYGLDDGALACVKVETGRRAWKGKRLGHGQVLLVGDVLLLMAEAGAVILFDPNPDEQRELTRFTALTSKTWNPPALAGEYLLVRNDKEAACFRLPVMN